MYYDKANQRRFLPDITFVLPFKNEEQFLEATLNTIELQKLNGIRAEILLINGQSTDGSLRIAERYVHNSRDNLEYRLIENFNITAPAAFNIGIRESNAPIVGFGGAHSLYPPNYFKLALHLINTVDTDVVGGGHDQILPSSPGLFSEAISCLYQSPIGAGVAPYHRLKKPSYVDTVYGGFYRRDVFGRVGSFNEKLVKNQDNELNSRVTASGLKIFYHPDLSTTYVQKTSLSSFLKRAFIFGSYHPTTWKVNPKSIKLRHIVPTMWIIYLVFLVIGELFLDLPLWTYMPLVLYLILLLLSSINLMRSKSIFVGLLTIPLFFVYHILYGLGTIIGFFLITSRVVVNVK